MNYYLIIVLISISTYATVVVGGYSSTEWHKFQVKYNKSYGNEVETAKRYKIFTDNLQIINEHNLKHEANESLFKLNVNPYTDKTSEEVELYDIVQLNVVDLDFEKLMKNMKYFETNKSIEIPNEIDWRLRGAVTSVKNQFPCGSCWAFSAVGALEGQYFKKSGILISLSTQNLVDCSTTTGNLGCNGGSPLFSYIHIVNHGGIETEASYPYEGRDGKCRFNSTNAETTFDGFGGFFDDEKTLKEAVAQIGPISVMVRVEKNLQHYDSGIYYVPDWISSDISHSMLIVGYGTDDELKQDYWLLKNSFGPNWGENGYIRMARNRDNNCGIINQACYPLIN